jgi:lipoate-protein ligase A
LWVDVVIPRGDALWRDDIGESMWWLGEAWQAALIGAGISETRVHRGAMISSDWSKTLCFAGVGPGEVLHVAPGATDSGGRTSKVVGISQRRNREMARFQCVMYRRWDVALHSRMLPALAGDLDRISACAWGPAELGDLVLLGQHIS